MPLSAIRVSLYATRGELDLALDELRMRLPAMIAEFPDADDFRTAFDAHALVIIEDASPADSEYVRRQLDVLLAHKGFPPLSGSPI